MTDTELTLMRLKPFLQGGTVRKPFSTDDGFTDGWWDDSMYGYATAAEVTEQYYAVYDGQTEVARAEVEVVDRLEGDYPAPSVPGPYAVIHFFEVSADYRRRGHGRQAIALLAARFEGTPLVAYSEDADEFWGSLGWERHPHQTEPLHHRPMYVATAQLR